MAKKNPNALKDNPLAMPANSGSDELLVLDEDTKAASLKAIQQAIGSLSWVFENVRDGTATKQVRFNGVSVAASYVTRLGELLGRDEDTEQEKQLRKSQLRVANDEIHRLRQEMAKGVTVEAMGNKLEELKKTVYYWWKSFGFLTADGNFSPNWKGADFHGKLSCYLDRHGGSVMLEDKPVTAKELALKTLEQLAEQTDIEQEDGSDVHFLDTPRNKDFLVNALTARFPGSRVWAFESNAGRSGFFHLRNMEVYIPIQSIEEKS